MQLTLFYVPLCITLVAFAGCGSSGNTDNGWQNNPPDSTSQKQKATFVTKTDTITSEGVKQRPDSSSPYNSAPVHFMIQIGSFLNARYAGAVQAIAQERYKLPVVNDFNWALKRYQIRIGFFETEKDADEFLHRLKTDYPQDYRDAWVVILNK